jgi:hypothetical protein
MINLFLRAKHWQLFLLTFGVMIIAYSAIMYFVFSDLISLTAAGRQPDPMVMFRYMKLLPLFVVFVVLVMMGWYWSVGVGLQTKLPATVTMKTNWFKLCLIVPAVYIVLMMVFINYVFEVVGSGESPDSIAFPSMMVFPLIVMPLQLFTIFCYFHNMYFVAKTLKTVELQRPTTFSDFIGEFFLTWFFPIGVWILQPRINALHKNGPGLQYGATDPTVLDETIRN